MPPTLWFNPKCSKCREALALLEARDIHPTLRRYLDEPPTRAELDALYDQLGFAMVREKECALTKAASREEVITTILAQPVALERPIFVYRDRAIVGRPPERVFEIL